MVAAGAAREPLGFAESDQPFLVDGDPTPGNATVLAGEAVSADMLPLRVRLQTGHSITLGPGSQARFLPELVRFDGVSAAFQAAEGQVLSVELGALRFRTAPGGGGVVYGDRPAVAAAWALGGPLEISGGGGEPVSLEPGAVGRFSVAGGELQVHEGAALEIARIQIRQLQHLEQMAATRPAVRSRVEPLLRSLADASGGWLRVEAGDRRQAVSFAAERLLEVALETHHAILTEFWADAGCGSPDCVNRRRVHRPADFAGWSTPAPPALPGCALCRRAGLGISAETGSVE